MLHTYNYIYFQSSANTQRRSHFHCTQNGLICYANPISIDSFRLAKGSIYSVRPLFVVILFLFYTSITVFVVHKSIVENRMPYLLCTECGDIDSLQSTIRIPTPHTPDTAPTTINHRARLSVHTYAHSSYSISVPPCIYRCPPPSSSNVLFIIAFRICVSVAMMCSRKRRARCASHRRCRKEHEALLFSRRQRDRRRRCRR